jgi:uncharacterized membrane protein YedE/YeeE
MRRTATAYLAGLLFGVGLVVSSMVDPAKIVGFLDVGGAAAPWNPALLAVMGGAVITHALLLRWLGRRPRGAGVPARAVPAATAIDRRLVIGSAIFGIGWGLTGYCPGPAIVSLGFGVGRVWAVVAAMIVGGLIAELLQQRARRTTAVPVEENPSAC